MKTHLNTLFVTSEGSYLRREGRAVVVRREGQNDVRVPVHNLSGVVCFGRVSCSPALMALCAESSVAISFLSPNGRFLAKVDGPVSGNVLLRRTQYRWADDAQRTAGVARIIVGGKIANCRSVLMRAAREHRDAMAAQILADAAARLGAFVPQVRDEPSLDSIRGIEGEAARTYFGAFDNLILQQKDGFRFSKRSRRPPLDPINALLSFAYTMLLHDVRSALETVGLDPAVGYLHRDRPGRPSLALDLMEELRPTMADRVVLSLVNRSQIAASDFCTREGGAVEMSDSARKQLILAWQARKNEEMRHEFVDERMTLGLAVLTQAQLFARMLRGDIDAYPPLVWR